MHRLRKALAKGSVPVFGSPLAEKNGSAEKPKPGLSDVKVARETSRQTDHRNEDRYPAVNEAARASWRDKCVDIRVTNFSSNGLQIETDQPVEIAEVLSVQLGDCESVECVVRWVRENRVGLEFEAETHILADAGVVGYVIENIESVLTASGERIDGRVGEERRGQAKRHGLVWLGSISVDEESFPARLRNISQGGAMIHVESMMRLKKGKTALLDLGQAGSVSGFVTWSAGFEVGFRFAEPFDVSSLANQSAAQAEILESGGAPQDEQADESQRPDRNYSNLSALDGKWQVSDHYAPCEESGRLTLEEVYATLYPNGRPEPKAAIEEVTVESGADVDAVGGDEQIEPSDG